MNRAFAVLGRAAVVTVLSAAFTGCAVEPTTPSAQLPDKVEAALKHSDHAGLVAYYAEEATAARDKANWHRRLAASYRSLSGGGASPNLAAHCESLARMYELIATEYDGMAQFHQMLAREPALNKS